MSKLETSVLVLNRNWQAIDIFNAQKCFAMMATDVATGMDFNPLGFFPVKWDDWIKLEIREGEDFISTPSIRIRVPRVIVLAKFSKVPLKRPRLTMKNLRERDGNKCAYTERILTPEESSMEHVQPRSKGGKSEWLNVCLADKKINNLRGNRSLKEAGLTLKIQPRVPEAKPFHSILATGTLKFQEWSYFVKRPRKS